ncbi:stalk domain-containing protein [Paenibacillus sp. GCM10027626]|uniref:stalk domain-containing protein n=1 Tax=Paenibacillus sp. GCM10027626 TaxID=3273411 RepID=UPI003625190E
MAKKLMALCISIAFVLTISQAVSAAADLEVKIVGQKEGFVHSPVVVDGITLFPITQILNFLDPSGVETFFSEEPDYYSFISFQGQCYKITHDQATVQEYEFEDSGACSMPTGTVFQMETPALYLDDPRLGIFVPLSFIGDLLTNSKYGNKFDIRQTASDSLEFSVRASTTTDGETMNPKPNTTPVILAMKINSPWLLTEDDGKMFDDENHSVTPVVKHGSTLLPISPIVNKLGGTVSWNKKEKKVTITLNQNKIELWLNKNSANVNGVKKTLNVPPSTIKGRTMLPVRFITENLGAKVIWDGKSQMVLIYYGGVQPQETDLPVYSYKISLLDAFQKQEDNRVTLEDAVKEIQKEHEKVNYNDYEPLDYNGNLIHAGNIVGKGTFSGQVKKINRTKILVYWNHASFLVDKGKEADTALFFGINWMAEQWVEAKTVVIESSGY